MQLLHPTIIYPVDKYPFDRKNFIKIIRIASGREIGFC